MVVKTQMIVRGRPGSAARGHGVPADQPPARLPDLRQGRRVPAAEPGHDQRAGRHPVRRSQAHLPEADQPVGPGAARPRALRLRAPGAPASPSRSPATRSSSCSNAVRSSRSASPRTCPFNSYYSGNTIQICPVGALTSAMYRFRSRPFDLVSTPTACEHCASGCALRTDSRRNSVMRRLAAVDPDVNEEWNCDKGRFAFRYVDSDVRLTHTHGPRGRRAPAGLVGRGARRRSGRAAGGSRAGGCASPVVG